MANYLIENNLIIKRGGKKMTITIKRWLNKEAYCFNTFGFFDKGVVEPEIRSRWFSINQIEF